MMDRTGCETTHLFRAKVAAVRLPAIALAVAVALLLLSLISCSGWRDDAATGHPLELTLQAASYLVAPPSGSPAAMPATGREVTLLKIDDLFGYDSQADEFPDDFDYSLLYGEGEGPPAQLSVEEAQERDASDPGVGLDPAVAFDEDDGDDLADGAQPSGSDITYSGGSLGMSGMADESRGERRYPAIPLPDAYLLEELEVEDGGPYAACPGRSVSIDATTGNWQRVPHPSATTGTALRSAGVGEPLLFHVRGNCHPGRYKLGIVATVDGTPPDNFGFLQFTIEQLGVAAGSPIEQRVAGPLYIRADQSELYRGRAILTLPEGDSTWQLTWQNGTLPGDRGHAIAVEIHQFDFEYKRFYTPRSQRLIRPHQSCEQLGPWRFDRGSATALAEGALLRFCLGELPPGDYQLRLYGRTIGAASGQFAVALQSVDQAPVLRSGARWHGFSLPLLEGGGEFRSGMLPIEIEEGGNYRLDLATSGGSERFQLLEIHLVPGVDADGSAWQRLRGWISSFFH